MWVTFEDRELMLSSKQHTTYQTLMSSTNKTIANLGDT